MANAVAGRAATIANGDRRPGPGKARGPAHSEGSATFGDTQITIAGNLVDDPELRFTPAGQPVARFRIASTPRFRDNTSGEWKDGDSLFLTVSVWRQAAENVAESLTRGSFPGDRVRQAAPALLDQGGREADRLRDRGR